MSRLQRFIDWFRMGLPPDEEMRPACFVARDGRGQAEHLAREARAAGYEAQVDRNPVTGEWMTSVYRPGDRAYRPDQETVFL